MTFPAYPEYKDSGVEWLGKVPVHWSIKALKHVVSIPITDGPHETPEFIDEGVPFVSAEAVSSGKIDFSKIRGFISRVSHEKYSQKYVPKRGDIFMVSRVPDGATSRANEGIYISPPRFVRKETQRVHWISRISFNFNAMRWTSNPPQIGAGLFGSSAIPPPNANSLRSTLLTSGVPALPTSEVVSTGQTLFDVHWSTTVSSKRLLSHPSIDSIEFIETTCEQR